MNKYTIFLTLVILAWAYVLWDEDQESDRNQEVGTTATKLKESHYQTQKRPIREKTFGQKSRVVFPTPTPSIKKLPRKRALQKKYQDLKKENLVEFKVKEGKVVAFGDVLLGEVDESIKDGFTYMEPLQYWEEGIVPYGIDERVEQKELVEEVIQYLNRETGLRFVPYKGQKDYLVFTIGEEHCYSYLGRIGGAQPIFLSPSCQKGSILHEILHALGFIHEHSRTDRDAYVSVQWDNIDDKFLEQFSYGSDRWMEVYERLQSPFDYNSIMLYPPEAFAIDPKEGSLKSITSEKIRPSKDVLSSEDKRRINYLYR